VRKPEGKRPLGRPRRRWEDDIKMDIQEVKFAGYRAGSDRNRWRELVNAIMKLPVP
jgi:hypothetical protein